jgi:plastocyanin domain-containing protein
LQRISPAAWILVPISTEEKTSMHFVSNYNPWVLTVEIILAAGLLLYFFGRRKLPSKQERHGPVRLEVKLCGTFTPQELRTKCGQPAQLVIHRLDKEPQDELFEIEELEIYELLPALHVTIISFNPQKRGRFAMIVGAERKTGTLIVE